ncbi:glycosyltransferase [Weissella cibaria]|uniref:glycosyltransferase n=1 Tax=Weissella cibaria TaxID=137591 RepID=UPI001C1FAFF4|nr:glycosyltransferase [Weissella cibaria]MBU7543550.1 glycosyltransferase [Weissella cibaria]MCV3316784.1 glycosyltransferase [Weissella cibaria]
MKRVLMVAAKANMIQQFNMRNLAILTNLGAEVHVAADFENFGTVDDRTNCQLIMDLTEMGIVLHQINFDRGLGRLSANCQVMIKLRRLIGQNQYDLIHVHSPIGAALTRLASWGMGCPVLYTAHGFHFFRGGPLKNWLVFPIEWSLAWLTQHLVVINHTDEAVSRFLPVQRVSYLPSVGAPVKRSLTVSPATRLSIRKRMRAGLGLTGDDFVIIQVGEFSTRKNQATLLQAVRALSNPQIKIFFAGVGADEATIKRLVIELGLSEQVTFLGYQSNLQDLHYAADMIVMPSLREGFGMDGFNALIDGVYMIGAKGTGMADYLIDKKLGQLINPLDVMALADAIKRVQDDRLQPALNEYTEFLMQFDESRVDKIMTGIYSRYLKVGMSR